ncbi:unnamed protein product [Durusdinium trenchii]|uniref:14-3-3 domain-containing protein n=1 Tax=Durusdinium trenchii TaxID=1381693 RepID=A0ABP0J7Z0_9DINO
MVEYMKDRVKAGKALSREEREMLAAAFKSAMSNRRLAVRVCKSIQSQEAKRTKRKNAALTSGYLTKVRLELQGLCIQILELIEGILLPKAENGEPMVFYKKLQVIFPIFFHSQFAPLQSVPKQADYYRYLAEFLEGDGHKEAVASAIEVYADATAEAERHLMVTHPVRLGLALNYAVFQQVIRKDDSSAVRIAKDAYLSAVRALEGMPQEAVRDAHPILALLQENLQVWSPEGFS